MKATVRMLATVVGVVLMVTAVGCPKKCVKPEEPIPPPPPPDTTPEIIEPATMELDLGTVYFDFDKSDIRKGDGDILRANADQIKQAVEAGQEPRVLIEGHCCPIGTSEYNMALGQRRAEATKAYLVKLGVGEGVLSTVSYGEEKLVTSDEAKYELNRRCEFVPEE